MKKIIILLSTVLLLNSCKKENKTPDDPAATPAAVATGSVITNGLPQNLNSVSGVLKADYVFQIINNAGFYDSEAALYNNPLPFSMGYLYSQVGDLSNDAGALQLNSTVLQKDFSNSPNLLYTDSTMNPNYSVGVTWLLNSTSAFPSFTTAVTRGFPATTGAVVLPDSVSISNGFTISLPNGGFSNADQISVFIAAGSSFFNKDFAGNANSLLISSGDLSAYSSGEYGAIYLYVKNYSNQTLNSKTLVYVMQKTWVNQLTFKP